MQFTVRKLPDLVFQRSNRVRSIREMVRRDIDAFLNTQDDLSTRKGK